jgi:hypothetical protein
MMLINPYMFGATPSTVALYHFDGADGSTTFTDSSPFNRSSTTLFGSPVISTAQSKTGGSSLYLNDDGLSSIFTSDAADLELGDSNFEFSFSIYPTASLAPTRYIFSRWGGGGNAYKIYIGGGIIVFYFVSSGGVSTAAGATIIPLNTWTDVSIAREGGFIKLKLNDVQDAIAGVSGSMLDSTSGLVIGTWPTGGSGFVGYIDNFKLDKF